MCTISTFNFNFVSNNRELVAETLRNHALKNPHGVSALFVDYTNSKKPCFIQTLDVQDVIDLLSVKIFDRVFIHCRFATSDNIGLINCHGFTTATLHSSEDNYYVFHNGVFDNKNNYRVDSLEIVERIRVTGIDSTIEWLQNETFANCLTVNEQLGTWYMTRGISGTLYTDNAGNYCSTPIAEINQPVAQCSSETHQQKMDIITDDDADFIDWIYDNGYDYKGIPAKYKKALTDHQWDVYNSLLDEDDLFDHKKWGTI